MGYTHYWNPMELEVDAKLAEEARAIVAASDVEVAGWDGTGAPEIREGLISLNGKGRAGCESFTLCGDDGTGFECCKTSSQPYDEVVGAILLAASERNPRINVSSDGRWSEKGWIKARALFEKAIGRKPEPPERMVDEYRVYRREDGTTIGVWLMCSGEVKMRARLDDYRVFESAAAFEEWASAGGWHRFG